MGVIEQANSVFVRLSGFDRDELVRAPHNIIRHPVMPGGAFHVMWDTLRAGEPFGAYVHNLAKTGSRYDVFATITPLGRGYLSVRTRPMCTDVLAVVDQLYTDAYELERSMRSRGAGRREAAAAGAARLAQLIADAGLGTYNDFLMDALPREVEAREAAGAICPQRPNATGPLAEMLALVDQTQTELGAWMAALARLSEQVASIRQAAEQLATISSEAAQTSRAIQAVDGLGFEFMPLMMPLQLWSEMDAEVAKVVDELIGDLKQFAASAARTRFRIALARLHATMIGNFTAEQIDGVPGAREQAPAISLLVTAISEGIEVMDAQSREHTDLGRQSSQSVEQVAGLMQMPIDLLHSWMRSSDRVLPDSIADLVPQISQQVADSTAAVTRLRELGDSLTTGVEQLDSARLRQKLAQIAAISSRLLDGSQN